MKQKPFYWKLGTLISTVIFAVFLLAGCGGGGDGQPLVAGTPNPPGGPTPPAGTVTDTDGDGVPDNQDAFPNDPVASVDTDGDGFPDAFHPNATPAQIAATNLVVDDDDDNDGIADEDDPTPLFADTDLDGIGNDVDDDIDGDGILNGDDAAPQLGISNIPTGSPFGATPLFGANAFEQQMVRFEEFGELDDMPTEAAAGWTPPPQPQDFQNGPVPAELEEFLAQAGVSPLPTRLSNVLEANPWNDAIQGFLPDALRPAYDVDGNEIPGTLGPAEGRPSGEEWAHQEWVELYPQKFFKTSVSQSRVNGGFRDARQRHGYALGEFGPGGLYNRVFTFGDLALDGTTAGVAIAFHPNMPVQAPNSIWTFDGTLPPKLLQVRYGEPVLMRNYNTLPVDVFANNGFGRHTITTHEHNGHSPGESDGFAYAFFFPGQFYDYRWPLQLAGYSNNNNSAGAINFHASDPKAAIPCDEGETFTVLVNDVPVERTCGQNGQPVGGVMIPGDYRETMSTHWFHDHMLDHTAENVYKGNATMMNYYSVLDRGYEGPGYENNLRFPSGTALSWGNRDYDVNLVVADKATDADGQLWYNTDDREGFLGDMMTVNFLYKPYFDVRARKYRFRFLNGAVSRIMSFGLVQEIPKDDPRGPGSLPGPAGSGITYNRVPFHMIANCGNVMEHAVPFDGQHDYGWGLTQEEWKGQLPSQTIAERYDIIVDFSKHGIQPGDKLYFVNIMEHANGRGTKDKIAMEDILSGKYAPEVRNGRWINGDPAVGKFLELRVHAYEGTDLSMNPADYEPGKPNKMIPLALDRASRTINGVSLDTALHRTFEYVRSGGGRDDSTPPGFEIWDEFGNPITEIHGPWFVRVDNNESNGANPRRISVMENGDPMIYTIKTGGGWTHPVHIHFEEGIILTRGGKMPPEWEKWARKDMYRIGPEGDSKLEVEVVFRARDFVGTYVQHCHNTLHEDHAMLLRWDAGDRQIQELATPIPDWGGVSFVPSFKLPTAATGDGGVGPDRGIPVN